MSAQKKIISKYISVNIKSQMCTKILYIFYPGDIYTGISEV